MQPARAGFHVKKFLVVAAASLLVVLAACSKEPAPTDATSSPVSTSAAASPSPSTTTSTPTSPAALSSGAPVVVDQSTPEAAMTSWLMAMFAGDTTAVCSLMASQGKAIADVPQAVETCSSMIGTMLDQLDQLDQLEPLAGAFTGLTIEGATVTGDTATFENATTQPAMAAQIIQSFKAVRIDGDWYVTEG